MLEQKQQIFGFDNFRLDVSNRQLLRDGRPVTLPAKAFDMLVVLVGNSGRLIEKDELFKRVWPDQIVEESNLTVQVSAIRKALREHKDNPRYIVTVPGHGYRFTGNVLRIDAEEELVIQRDSVSRLTIETESEATDADAPHVHAQRPAKESAAEGRPTSTAAHLVGRTRRQKWVARALAVFWVVSVAVIILGAVELTVWLRNSRARRQSATQPSQSAQPSGPLQTMKIHRLTSSGRAGSATISPDGKYVVYKDDDNEGRQALWIKQVATGSALQLVPADEVVYLGTTFSRDGNHVYYSAQGKETPSGALFRIPSLGGESKKLLEGISSPVTQSPDGRQIAFIRPQAVKAARAVLMAANSDGTDVRQLASLRSPGSFYFAGPAWSPDGETIVCGGYQAADGQHASVFAIQVEDGSARQLTSHIWRKVDRLCWLDDGSGLVMLAVDAGQDFSQLWEVAYPSGEAHRITNDLSGHGQTSLGLSTDSKTLAMQQVEETSYIWITGPDGDASGTRQLTFGEGRNDGRIGLAWAHDGSLIYTALIGGSQDLWRVRQDGTGHVRLTEDSYIEAYPAVTSDGRALVFRSTRADGKQRLWRMVLDGGRPEPLTVGEEDHAPRTSHDGQWVVYCALSADQERLWKVPINGGEPIRLTDHTSQWPDVSSDGKLIAYTFYDDGAKPPRWRGAVMPFDGGPPVKTFALPPTANLRIRWTADASAVAYIDTHNGVSNIWSQPVDGGAPRQLTNFESGIILNFDISRDGKQLACARGSSTGDVILITDFR